MRKIIRRGILMAATVALAATFAQADEAKPAGTTTPGVSQSVVSATPTAKTKKAKKIRKTAKEAKDNWVCPMGDYSGSKTADGKCPKCGMDLVKQEKAPASKDEPKKPESKPSTKADSKKTVWVCPMGDYSSDKPGKCPNCGMDLVEKK